MAAGRRDAPLCDHGKWLEWRPVGSRGWPGLRVTDEGAGSSEAELRVECGEDVAPDVVYRVLDRALGGLATEVDQNFNVSRLFGR